MTQEPIVSPEDFERFWRGEMTREELLEIKKKVDSCNASGNAFDDEYVPFMDKCGEQYIPD